MLRSCVSRRFADEIVGHVLEGKAPPDSVEALKQGLEAAQAELRRQSQDYRRYLQAKRATAQDVQDALPQDGALIEYRFFIPYDFEKHSFGVLHVLAAVLTPSASPALFDLGEADTILAAQQLLIDARLREEHNIPLTAARRFAFGKLMRRSKIASPGPRLCSFRQTAPSMRCPSTRC